MRGLRPRTLVILAVAVAALVAMVLVLREDTTPPADPAARRDKPVLYEVDFATAAHWYGLRADCTPSARPCGYRLVDSDNGQVRLRELPDPLRGNRSHPPRLHVLGPAQLALTAEQRTWHSGDRGQTWREGLMAVDWPVDGVGDTALLERACVDKSGKKGCDPWVHVVLPVTGQRVPLVEHPPLTEAFPFPRLLGGRWWVVGKRNGKAAVSTSVDKGRGWQTRELPVTPGGEIRSVELAEAAGVTYVQIGTDERPGAAMLFRGEGDRWEQVWRDDPTGSGPRLITGLGTRPDGRLLVVDGEGASWVSGDGGRAFTPAKPEERVPGNNLRTVRGGLLSTSERGIEHSTDGLRWTPLPTG